MPQMMPMNWMFLFMFMLFNMYILKTNIYFFMNKNIKIKYNNNKKKLVLNFKW
uniref:ATP synthase F0 subunit 8 n=1 Tax=Uroobovella oviformis TaxID=3106009 RepID=UPI002E795848|nr:ATP synthase F0 subunit 8 [Uroobovella oviformis]WPV72072.1 ATP synthase F0 subunit 8 [Uroobovella oviformis]